MYHNSIQNVIQTNIHVTHVCTNAGEMSSAQTVMVTKFHTFCSYLSIPYDPSWKIMADVFCKNVYERECTPKKPLKLRRSCVMPWLIVQGRL